MIYFINLISAIITIVTAIKHLVLWLIRKIKKSATKK